MPSTHFDFQQAKANHLLFKSRLRAILYGETPEAETAVLSQYACSVGRWIYSHALIAHEAIPEVHTLEQVHAAIHTTARELVVRYQQGQLGEARQGLVRVEQLADELVHLLDVVEAKVTATNIASTRAQLPETVQPSAVDLTDLLQRNQRLDARIRSQSAEMAQKELIFDTIMAVSPVALWMSDARGAITYLNHTWIDWTGKPFAAHLGGGWLDSILEEDRSRAEQQFVADLAAQRPYVIDFRIRRQNGTALWCAVTGQPWYTSEGTFGGYVGSGMDVTEQVIAQEKLQESKDQLAFAIEATELGTWDYNMLTGASQWSATCKQLFGLSPDAAVTASQLVDRVHPADREAVRQANARVLGPDSDGLHDIIFRTLRDGDDARWVHAKGKTLVDGQGRIIRFSGIVFDITKLKQVQEALQQNALVLEQRVQQRTQELDERNRDLHRSNQNLEQFAYIASHDLQEPLRKIQQFGDLLKNGYAAHLGEGVDYLERMQAAAGRMSTLIKDLLTFSRISTGQETRMVVSLTKVVQAVVTDLELRIEETGAVVTIEPLPAVQGDASQLGQLFQNLMSNALKFRRPDVRPQIRVSSHLVAAVDLPARIKPARWASAYHRIDLSDNGIGFDEQYLDRIFLVFQRLHGRHEFAGTGIGLAICEKVAANHGGSITASSEPGQGATFSVYLPQFSQ